MPFPVHNLPRLVIVLVQNVEGLVNRYSVTDLVNRGCRLQVVIDEKLDALLGKKVMHDLQKVWDKTISSQVRFLSLSRRFEAFSYMLVLCSRPDLCEHWSSCPHEADPTPFLNVDCRRTSICLYGSWSRGYTESV